ncbi:hypothetical protein DIE19_21265 [Burkholderia sp. Bp9126]|nr:hypothetical protein DIE19_21265 [Burkholderia sp. Bp9126]
MQAACGRHAPIRRNGQIIATIGQPSTAGAAQRDAAGLHVQARRPIRAGGRLRVARPAQRSMQALRRSHIAPLRVVCTRSGGSQCAS